MFKHIYQINEQAFIIDFGSIINIEINNNKIVLSKPDRTKKKFL